MKQTPANYKKIGIIAAAVVVVAGLGAWGISALRGPASVDRAISDVSSDAVTGADLRIAVVRMDMIQTDAKVLKSLAAQKESMEKKLKSELEAEQKALEKEKKEIEKSQDVLSQEALQRRVVDFQNRVAKLQRDVTTKAQAADAAYQAALAKIQKDDLDPIIAGIIAKKNLSVVLDGRMARVNENIANFDITKDVIRALDIRRSDAKLEKPKGF
ncbi:MAG: OmpH family outer membrane protein [Rickettsiales bacterium]|jgi:Skp family chaperone for outer membrane proteins|nr:OmpH family outer membrane protein [Rickettsiales bacterium]